MHWVVWDTETKKPVHGPTTVNFAKQKRDELNDTNRKGYAESDQHTPSSSLLAKDPDAGGQACA